MKLTENQSSAILEEMCTRLQASNIMACTVEDCDKCPIGFDVADVCNEFSDTVDRIVKANPSKEEFIKRFVAFMNTKKVLADSFLAETAEIAFENWDGIDTPEDCAEEELSNWDR